MRSKLGAIVALLVAAAAIALMVLQHQEIARLRRMLLLTALGRAGVGSVGSHYLHSRT
jgi:hypothetical protein